MLGLEHVSPAVSQPKTELDLELSVQVRTLSISLSGADTAATENLFRDICKSAALPPLKVEVGTLKGKCREAT